MVIVRLSGGLGNQMFQYAAARALAWAREQPLTLDVSGFETDSFHRQFELARVFDCAVTVASAADLRKVLGWQASDAVRRALLQPALACLRSDAYVVEPHFRHWRGLEHVPDDCYLCGYWQSEKYFAAAAATLRADFRFRQRPGAHDSAILERIAATNAVSVHLRRGDFAADATVKAKHGLCPPDYYHAASRYVAERVAQPHFFVFSDDIDWAKDNFQLEFPCSFIDHNRGADSSNDMRLMSACRHHICANSSFSWWGAWLNPKPDKIVIAPRRWFAGEIDASDLIPGGWVTL